MKELILNYIKMIRAGFLRKSFIGVIFIVIFSAISVNRVVFNAFEVVIFLIFGSSILSVIWTEFSGNKYVIFTTIPVKLSDSIKLMYFHTYTIYVISIILSIIAEIVINKKVSIIYLISISMFTILANLIYPNFSTKELKLGAAFDEQAIIIGILHIIGVILIAIFSAIWNMYKIQVSINIGLAILIISILVTACTLKISYKITLKKAMGI